ncbi:uncharacterized protein TNCV_1567631 [Trichonephila clavipes]|nr:uncharacterized protein TNCV_1567631 [Trichonephila clavipes]
MRTRCLKCGESHRTNECPIKDKIQNHYASIATRRDTWQIGLLNLAKPQVTPNLSFAAALSGALKLLPELRPPLKKPSINENSNDKDFGLKDAIRELRRFFFFLDYPFLLEMGRLYAKDEERLDIFLNLVKKKSKPSSSLISKNHVFSNPPPSSLRPPAGKTPTIGRNETILTILQMNFNQIYFLIFNKGKDLFLTFLHAQEALNLASDWSKGFKLGFNPDKSRIMAIEKRSFCYDAFQLYLDGTPLSIVKQMKYLGVLLDAKFSWKQHLSYISEKCDKLQRGLNRIARNTFGINFNVHSLIYKQGTGPFILYGSRVWGEALKRKMPFSLHKLTTKLSGAAAHEGQGQLRLSQFSRPWVYEQILRSGGQSETKPQVFSSRASLVLIYPINEGMKGRGK